VHGGYAGHGCWLLTNASLQLFGHKLVGTGWFRLEMHWHERERESTVVPHVTDEHEPTREHWHE
jgi:hypothetical protein